MPITLPQDQSTGDTQLDDRVQNRRVRIKQARQKNETKKVDKYLQVRPKKNEVSVTIPIETWQEVILLARMGQQSLQHETDERKISMPNQKGETVRESDSNHNEHDGSIYKHRISATIAALRRQ